MKTKIISILYHYTIFPKTTSNLEELMENRVLGKTNYEFQTLNLNHLAHSSSIYILILESISLLIVITFLLARLGY